MSPRLPTQGHPCPRNWQKLCRLETSLSAKRSGAMSPDTSVRHSGHCDFCGSQSSRQAPQKTCLCHRSARTVSTEVPLGKVKCVSARQRWVVLGTGSSLRAHPHAVRTGCVKSFRQIGQIRLGSGGLSSYCFTSTGRRWRWGRAGRRWSDRPVPARLIGVGVPEVSVSRVSVLRFAPFGRQVAHDWRGATVERSFLSARLGVVAPARTLFWAPLMEGRGRGRGGIRLD